MSDVVQSIFILSLQHLFAMVLTTIILTYCLKICSGYLSLGNKPPQNLVTILLTDSVGQEFRRGTEKMAASG